MPPERAHLPSRLPALISRAVITSKQSFFPALLTSLGSSTRFITQPNEAINMPGFVPTTDNLDIDLGKEGREEG